MGLLEGRTESISGEFKSQSVANTLWVYVTKGRNLEDGGSGDGSVGGLVGDDIRSGSSTSSLLHK